MTTETDTNDDSTHDDSTHPDPEAYDHDDRPTVTGTLVGARNENHDGVVRGCYPEGLDPADFAGTLRRFVGKTVQYIYVVGDLNGHAIYRTLNEGKPDHKLHALPWDRFIEETAQVLPGVVEPPEDPARRVIRTDFDTLRARREQEIETGCTCLPGEGCDHCGGKASEED